MTVVQSTWGTFHQFELAKQFHERGMLECIFSTFPHFRLQREGLPKDKIQTFPWYETPLMLKWKFGFQNTRVDREWSWLNAKQFCAFVSKHLPACDVFIALSGAGLEPGSIAQSRGAKYICDRGSTHIRYVERLMHEEFRRWGQVFDGIDPRPAAKEEAEYALADAITVPSEFARRSFLEMGVSQEKMHKIPYGVNVQRFQKVADPAEDRFDVLFVGQVSFRKGVPYLLEGFSRLKHPKKHLKIVGAIQPEMNTFLREKQFEHVEFLGAVPQLQLKEIMSKSHVMVLPSVEDGLACVQAQAMACGCPLISSVNTGAEDLFENGKEGFIVPPRDSAAIAECLENIASDRNLRQSMSSAALERVKRIGGWQTYGEGYSALCKNITASMSAATT